MIMCRNLQACLPRIICVRGNQNGRLKNDIMKQGDIGGFTVNCTVSDSGSSDLILRPGDVITMLPSLTCLRLYKQKTARLQVLMVPCNELC